ncbi:MAG: imidazole glycerol phosphate synthase subunit HisH, partial [Pseudomonadota bacterium]
MTSKVVVVDYGSGNLHSAGKAIERAAREHDVDARVVVSADPKDVRVADRVMLPGVGAFGDCYAGLTGIPGMMDALDVAVVQEERPFLGICVGMQLMATRGLEFGTHAGLDWIGGEVRAIAPNDPSLKIPHMGWNTLRPASDGGATEIRHPVFDGIPLGTDGLHAYFVHTFHFVPDAVDHTIGVTDYSGPITAVVARDNLVGT